MKATNGNGVYKWAAGGLALALSGVVAFAANNLSDTVKANTDSVINLRQTLDAVESRVDTNELNIAKQTLQLAEIAKAVRAPVILDTARATLTVARDSTR